jgi:hypothetical protein
MRLILQDVDADEDSGAGSCFSIAEQGAKNEEDEVSRSHDDSSASSPDIWEGHRSQQSTMNICCDKASSSSSSMLPTEVNAVALPRVLTQSTDEEDSLTSPDEMLIRTNEHSSVNKNADSIWFDDELPCTTDSSLSIFPACKPSMMVSDTEVTVTWKIHPGTNNTEDIISWIRQTFPGAVLHNKTRTLSEEVDSIHNDYYQGERQLKDGQSSNSELFFNDIDINDSVGLSDRLLAEY